MIRILILTLIIQVQLYASTCVQTLEVLGELPQSLISNVSDALKELKKDQYVRLKNGPLISPNCREVFNQDEFVKLIEKLESSIDFMKKTYSSCQKLIGFGNETEVFEKLENMLFKCDPENEAAMYAKIAFTSADNPWLDRYFTKSAVAAGSPYSSGELSHIVGIGSNFSAQDDKTKTGIKYILETKTPNVAGSIFHELLHFSQANNLNQHLSHIDHGKEDKGCSSDIFKDRILLTHGACFPSTGRGYYLYEKPDDPVACQERCVESLTTVDESFKMKLSSVENYERVLAVPYNKNKASRICHNINRVRKKLNQYSKISKKLESFEEDFSNYYQSEFERDPGFQPERSVSEVLNAIGLMQEQIYYRFYDKPFWESQLRKIRLSHANTFVFCSKNPDYYGCQLMKKHRKTIEDFHRFRFRVGDDFFNLTTQDRQEDMYEDN